MSDIVKHTPRPLDSFADFDTSIEGDDGERFAGTLRGTRLKFTNEATWETANGADFSDHELVAVDLRRMEVKWGDGKPLPETRELGPGERYRNLEELNKACPKSEWREGFDGKLHGPWQHQHVLELVDPVSMDCFSYPASTIGGSIAVSNLRDSHHAHAAIRRRRHLSARAAVAHAYEDPVRWA